MFVLGGNEGLISLAGEEHQNICLGKLRFKKVTFSTGALVTAHTYFVCTLHEVGNLFLFYLCDETIKQRLS